MATLAKELEKRLERLGVKESPRRLEAQILAAVDDLLAGMNPMDPLRNLAPEEQDALRRGGMVLEEIDLGQGDPVLKTSMRFSAMVATGLTVSQASSRLGIDESRVRHRLGDRTLYGFKVRNSWVLPAFQFDAEGVISGIGEVTPHLPADLHPVGVLNWFMLPNPELVAGDTEEALSPREWLASGRDPEGVAALADEL